MVNLNAAVRLFAAWSNVNKMENQETTDSPFCLHYSKLSIYTPTIFCYQNDAVISKIGWSWPLNLNSRKKIIALAGEPFAPPWFSSPDYDSSQIGTLGKVCPNFQIRFFLICFFWRFEWNAVWIFCGNYV